MVNEKMLREKIGSLEMQNMRLVHKLKELLGAKGDIRRAINLINDHCKQNDCSVVVNKNNLIKEIKYNTTSEFPEDMKAKQKGMKNLDININMKVPDDITLDDTYRLVNDMTKCVNPKSCVSWELEKEKLPPEELLSLTAQEKLKNDSQFENMFKDFFGDRLIQKKKLYEKIQKLESEVRKLKKKKGKKK